MFEDKTGGVRFNAPEKYNSKAGDYSVHSFCKNCGNREIITLSKGCYVSTGLCSHCGCKTLSRDTSREDSIPKPEKKKKRVTKPKTKVVKKPIKKKKK